MIDLRQKGLASHWLVGLFAGLMGFIGFSSFEPSDRKFEYFDDSSLCYHVPYAKDGAPKHTVSSLVLNDSYIAFKEALAFKESGGDYTAINRFGYLGKYQFHSNTLKLMGIYDKQRFLEESELQEEAFFWYAARNKWILRKDLRRSVGQRINGIEITESGILAAAHLAGAGNVKKYLRSGGTYGFEDAFGTSIEQYLKEFAHYDTAEIPAHDQWINL
jgi:hypothetical protein